MVTSSLHQFDGDPADDRAWQAFVAANSESSAAEPMLATTPSTALNALYELFLLFVVVVALVGTVLWQRSVNRLAELEAQVQALQEQLALADTPLKSDTVSTGTARERAQPSVLHLIESDYFRFVVDPGNMAVVSTVVARIDANYRQLCADLGVDAMLGQDKLMIYVIDNTYGRKSSPYAEDVEITVDLSSYGQVTTTGWSEQVQLIYNDLFGQLARHTLDEALSNRQIKLQWNAVIDSLYRYLAQSQLPKPVGALQSYELQRCYVAQTYSPNLAKLRFEPGDWMYPDYTVAYAAADPLVEYILVTYGRESIPQLLDALREYGDWAEIAPAAFSVPVGQFEAEWHTYLQAQYPYEPFDSVDVYGLEPAGWQ